jgi:hemoglobin/transferrin/lactoferrin receptor protein
MLLLIAGRAHAQEADAATARVPHETFDSIRSEDHVDRARSDEAGAANVGDALEQAEHVTVQRTSSASAAPILRGLTGYRVLLLADDLRLNDALTRSGGNALLNLIDPESVERIEVVRGPASVLHGSDALGGVVRVHTRGTGAAPSAEPTAGATAYARGASAERAVRVQGAVHAVQGRLGARVSGGRGHAGELLRGGGLGEQPFTGSSDWSLASRVEAAPSGAHRLWFSHQSGHLFDVPRTDVSTPDDQQDTMNLDRDAALLGYAGRLSTLRLRAHAGLALRREFRQRRRGGTIVNERERVLSYSGSVSAVVSPWLHGNLEAGAEAVLEDIGSGGEIIAADGVITRGRGRYVDGSRYDSYALYALLTHSLTDRLLLLAGARATLVSARAPVDPLFDPAIGRALQLDRRLFGVVGSAGTRYDLNDELALSVSLLSGFRAPNLEDFQALGGGARGFAIPNPELDEERSFTLETGLKLNTRAWQASAFVFGSLLTGLIERVPSTWQGMTEIDGERVQTPENASRSMLLGAELSLVRRTDGGAYAGVAATTTYGETVRPSDDGRDVDEPASKVPPPIFAVQVGFDRPDLPYWAQAVVQTQLPQARLSESDRNDVRICEDGPEDCEQVDGYAVLTLRAGLRLAPGTMLALALENALDAGYKTYASGAYAPGRNVTLAVRGSL